MGSVLAALTVGVFILGLSFDKDSMTRGFSLLCLSLGAILFVFTALYLSPRELGYGHVPVAVERYTYRLDAGVVYQLLASAKEGEDEVLLVKKEGGSDMYAIRVKGPVPPERFTLIDGKPVEVK